MYTVQMILDKLDRNLVSGADILSGDPVSSVRITSSEKLSENLLYLSPAEDGGTCFRTAAGSRFRYAADIGATLNRVMEILGAFQAWESELHEAIRRGCTLTELLDLAYPLITYPMVILDNRQWMIACSSILKEKEFPINRDLAAMLEFRTTSPERIKEFNLRYSSCYSRRDVYKIPGGFFSDTGYTMNLFLGNQLRGIMLIDSFQEDISPGKLDLFFLLGTHIQTMLNDPASGLSIRHEDSPLLQYLSFPDEASEKALRRDLKITGWKDEDDKLLVFIAPDSVSGLSPNTGRAITMFNRLFGLLAAPWQEGVLLFINNRMLNERGGYEPVLQRITQLSYCAGVSGTFTELEKLPVMAERACIALQHGEKSSGTVNHFRDHYLRYFFSLKEARDRDILAHPFPELLRDYDRRFGSRLYETAFRYLKNERGITKCAREMGLSRSTLLHRVERIEELSEGLLEDPETRLHILLTYYLEQNSGSEQ